MPRLLVLLMLTFAVGAIHVSSAEPRADEQLPITIQIHDYWHLRSQSLSRASEIVTHIYDKIGVRTEWLGVVQQEERRSPSAPRQHRPRAPLAQVTMIILTPTMAARGHIVEGSLGFAAVPTEGMGRIAYAIYDRVRDTASKAAMNEDDLLGFVMAHEIGHLMLPQGVQSDSGVMRSHWTVSDFRLMNVLTLGFSPGEASQIRSTLESDAPRFAAIAGAAAASRQVDRCTPAAGFQGRTEACLEER